MDARAPKFFRHVDLAVHRRRVDAMAIWDNAKAGRLAWQELDELRALRLYELDRPKTFSLRELRDSWRQLDLGDNRVFAPWGDYVERGKEWYRRTAQEEEDKLQPGSLGVDLWEAILELEFQLQENWRMVRTLMGRRLREEFLVEAAADDLTEIRDGFFRGRGDLRDALDGLLEELIVGARRAA